MKVLTSLVFFLLLMHHSFSLSTPLCHVYEQTFSCSGQNLTKVPAAPSQPITQLNISHNGLEAILKDDFLLYASLRSLIMTGNEIKTIQEEAFDPLVNLEKLDLSLNRLDALSAGWFKNLFSLQYLNLLGNEYKTLGQGNLFQPLRNLKTLHVGGPHLQSVRKSDFSGLSGLNELFFDGKNLQYYAPGSLGEIGTVSHVTVGLNGPFLENPMLVYQLLSDVVHPNTTLTVTDTALILKFQNLPLRAAFVRGATGLVFKDVTMSFEAFLVLLHMLPGTNVTMFAIEDAEFFLTSLSFQTIPKIDSLEVIFFKNVVVPRLFHFPALNFMEPLLKMVRKVSVINSMLFAVPCETSKDLSHLEYLDISDNIFSDLVVTEMMCEGKGVLWNLHTLNISRNHLRSLNSHLFTKLEKLENIDLSGNVFYHMPELCMWPPNLRLLNLSSTHLSKATFCLPKSLHILDLSNNELSVFNITLPLLRELYISGNKIVSLPDGRLYPRLESISIQNNDLQTFSSNILNGYNSLKRLEAAADTYVCSCDFKAFVTRDLAKHRVSIADDVSLYICDSPDAVRGKSVADAVLSVFECHTALALSLLCCGILAVFLLVIYLCHRYSVVWYVKMTWVWLRAKRKPKINKGDLEYDAFVSYSQMDAGWVEAHLVPELEQSEPPFRLCLHKRDFLPGGRIIDNIMAAIEKSHKTLFILSQHFVNSEWCKYELDYTHFRLFDHNDDTVVLILLGAIDKNAIPSKFCKLRKVMNSRTYLEWPDNEEQVARFWQSLRAAMKRPDNDEFIVLYQDGDVAL